MSNCLKSKSSEVMRIHDRCSCVAAIWLVESTFCRAGVNSLSWSVWNLGN